MRRSRNDMTAGPLLGQMCRKDPGLHRMPGGHRANPGAGERDTCSRRWQSRDARSLNREVALSVSAVGATRSEKSMRLFIQQGSAARGCGIMGRRSSSANE